MTPSDSQDLAYSRGDLSAGYMQRRYSVAKSSCSRIALSAIVVFDSTFEPCVDGELKHRCAEVHPRLDAELGLCQQEFEHGVVLRRPRCIGLTSLTRVVPSPARRILLRVVLDHCEGNILGDLEACFNIFCCGHARDHAGPATHLLSVPLLC